MREDGNLDGEVVHVGDIVVANRQLTGQYRVNTNDTFNIQEGDRFTVTRVYGDSLQIRSLRTYSVRVSHHHQEKQVSFGISRLFLMYDDPNYVPPPPPRKLGAIPTHEEARLSEDVEIIGPDHPGIQWLFEDMGAFATQKGYCPQYDALCAKLGIPGRPRDFTVRTNIRGIQLTTTVSARSQREANQIVKDALAEPQSVTIDPDYAPAA